jgi:membrane fusion protein (multidrug efflux system)
MRYLALALFGVLIVGLSSCDRSSEAPVIAAEPSRSQVTTQAIRQPEDPPGENLFTATGPVVVENQVDVEALRDGVVVSIAAQPGTHVRRGQLLAKLDDRQISADVNAAVAKTRSIEANLKNWQAETKVLQADRSRAEKLYAAQVIPKEELEHAQYKEEADEYEVQREAESLNNAKAVQQSLELEKDKTSITAPFDGIVARRYVRVGQKVTVGDRLFWVTALGPLQIKFTLPERLIGTIAQGQSVTVSCAEISTATQYTAKVLDVSPVVDPSSGTIEVLAEIQGKPADLRPGMLANVRIDLPK